MMDKAAATCSEVVEGAVRCHLQSARVESLIVEEIKNHQRSTSTVSKIKRGLVWFFTVDLTRHERLRVPVRVFALISLLLIASSAFGLINQDTGGYTLMHVMTVTTVGVTALYR
jgi:hypothetical protein